MDANPFNKSEFGCYRDWEESLLNFFTQEARCLNVDNWLFLTNEATKENIAFCALLLSNWLELKPDYLASSVKATEVYRLLKNTNSGAVEYGIWLRSGWLNIPRIANQLNLKLRQK